MNSSNSEILDQLLNIFPFSQLPEDEVADLLKYCQFVECKPGTALFDYRKKADFFYFILDGEVKICGTREKAAIGNSKLSAGDHFGEEAIHSGTSYKTRAECTSQTRLVSISHKNLAILMAGYPIMNGAFALFYQSWQVADDLVLQWLAPNEKVYLVSRRHKIIPTMRVILINAAALIGFTLLLFASFSSKDYTGLLMVLAFLVLLGGVLTSIWAVAEWANDEFIITNGRVIAQRQLYGFFDSRQESPINAILSTSFDTSLIGRLVGYGTVNLRSYTGEIKFKQLPYPRTIFDYLEYLRNRSVEDKKAEEKRNIEQSLVNRLDGNGQKTDTTRQHPFSTATSSIIYQSGSLLDWLARFFQLRQAKGNSIIYRTHWWIMVKKTMVPFLLLAILFLGFVGRIMGLFSTITETSFYAVTFALALMSALWWLYQYFDWYNDQYILTKDQLIDVSRKPLGYEDRRSAPVKNIQTVEFKRKGLVGLVLNFGTVRVQIGNEELTFDNVYDPSQIQGEVYLQLKNFQDEQQRLEGQRMAEWITTYDQIKRGRDPEN